MVQVSRSGILDRSFVVAESGAEVNTAKESSFRIGDKLKQPRVLRPISIVQSTDDGFNTNFAPGGGEPPTKREQKSETANVTNNLERAEQGNAVGYIYLVTISRRVLCMPRA